MGYLFTIFANSRSVIIIDYCIPSGSKYDYLRPKGTIYNVPTTDARFDDFYGISMRLWCKISAHKDYFLMLERTPPVTSSESSDEIGYGTVFLSLDMARHN